MGDGQAALAWPTVGPRCSPIPVNSAGKAVPTQRPACSLSQCWKEEAAWASQEGMEAHPSLPGPPRGDTEALNTFTGQKPSLPDLQPQVLKGKVPVESRDEQRCGNPAITRALGNKPQVSRKDPSSRPTCCLPTVITPVSHPTPWRPEGHPSNESPFTEGMPNSMLRAVPVSLPSSPGKGCVPFTS